MQKSDIAEILLSAIVLAVGIGFLLFVSVSTGTGSLSSYDLTARLAHANGLDVGADVRLAGLKIGTIHNLTLDPKTYLVTVRMNIRSDVRIARDSTLLTSGELMGSSYLSVKPGNSSAIASPGGILLDAH